MCEIRFQLLSLMNSATIYNIQSFMTISLKAFQLFEKTKTLANVTQRTSVQTTLNGIVVDPKFNLRTYEKPCLE
ncbi:hypothetical protein L596_000272 [Steinernema carpocapsae]|uniref:Uncharacterized protein n=1 Tax=Steinernema carpocapsae TaxID=34508 RepID=A0A4U8ULW5_STECR|nr:hypothetical protein L596_000272 [Steinernema carpocapsae]